MSDHPTTFDGEPADHGFNWDDRAALHEAHDGRGILDSAKALRRGTMAEMVQHIMLLPDDKRGGYVIQKAGDRMFTAKEAVALSERPDFPRGEA